MRRRAFGELSRRHVTQDLPHDLLRASIRARGADGLEHPRHRADVGRDAHAVVVQHHDHPPVVVADVVQPFEGETGRERAVPDDGNDVEVLLLQVARERHAVRGGDRRAGVTRSELVVLGFGAHQEPGDAAELAQRVEARASPGEHLMDVCLMPGVPHELVARRIEHPMQRNRELDGAQTGRDVPPVR